MKELIIRKRRNYVQRTCRIEEDILDKIDKIAYENNLVSSNALINECLRFALDNMKIEE